MIRFSATSPEVLRRINLSLLDSTDEYVVVDEAIDQPAKVRAQIAAVPAERVQAVLNWVGDVPLERFEQAWPRFMAGNIAQQLWPDGNHRTSFLYLSNVARLYLEESFSLPVSEMEELLAGSKALLQARPTLPGRPVFPLGDLDDPAHSYRRHFEAFVPRLRWKSVPS